jgi:hypothetical protein
MTVQISIVFVAVLILYLYVGRRERARRTEEAIPRGIAGLRDDIQRHLPDRIFLVGLVASWGFFTFAPAAYRWFSGQDIDWFTWHKILIGWLIAVFAISIGFFWRRRELEKLHTYQAATVAAGVVLLACLVSSYHAQPPGFQNNPDPLNFVKLGVVTFFGTYFVLRRAAGL